MEESEPVSPTGQYFTSSVISIAIIAVLESEHPIDDSQTTALLQNVFLPISPRFSSVMVQDKDGSKHWKKVDVKLQEHVHVPIYPPGQPTEFYDKCLSDYLSKIAMEPLPHSRPLWEIHIFKYPTHTAAGNVVFKLHHALGDGYSLMGALLSCLQRADNPAVPLTFPSLNPQPNETPPTRGVCGYLSGAMDTVRDFGWSLLKSSVVEDDRTPIRSGDDGVEFRPITLSTVSFSLDRVKQVKSNLNVTINDVICGVLFLGIRLYMQGMKQEQRNAEATSLVLLNTRNIGGYKSVSEMVEPEADSPWGNQFAFLHVSVPKLGAGDIDTPLSFVMDARKVIKRKRNSAAVVLTGKLLDTLRKWRGPEVTAKYIHSTLKNTSMTISNIMGPMEQMSLSNQPIKGFYFMVVGVPQSLTITMVSYMGELRVAVGTENGLIDAPKFKSCIQKAFDLIFNAAVTAPSIAIT
ncbi:o-acyltransferase wsd1 [Phtheirospermum japonicum]|uniref:O-acyltransferase wsd1 n=1 Tax=Phtheirospermum japonicum TaxID=374723 RepID=A0A830BJN7_9LAMI|nr:o-acyltransferase wsd1 [Phtheirospermum japonicum]